jgi:hypothetical protein
MHKLMHDRLSPFSLSVRLALTDFGIDVDLVEEGP